MPAIITTNMRVYASDQFMNSFADVDNNVYLFIGRTLSWLNDNSPPAPVDSIALVSESFRDMVALKKILSTDASQVIYRHNWTSGTVYTQYNDNIDLFNPLAGPFYAVTDDLNVYKCLSNNSGGQSTVMPTGTSLTPFQTSDLYVWKYMFTVSSSDVLKFVTSEWIPVKLLTSDDGSQQWQVQVNAIPGTVDRIDIVTQGTQYSVAPTVVIDGDGVDAQGQAVISNGNVVAVNVLNAGSGYKWATVTLVGGGVGANGATARAVLSPMAGHGSNAVHELGGSFVLINAKLIYDESGVFPVDNDFRRIGLLQNPYLWDTTTKATGLAYNQTVGLTFSTTTGADFLDDQLITGQLSLATGRVADWNPDTKFLRLVEVDGVFLPGETVENDIANATGTLNTYSGSLNSATSSTARLPNGASSVNDFYTGMTIRITSGPAAGALKKIIAYNGVTRDASVETNWAVTPSGGNSFAIGNINYPDLEPYTGNILYVENRRPIMRALDQVEDIKLVMEF